MNFAEPATPGNPAGKIHEKKPILENAIYGRAEAVEVTGLSQSTLIRAEESGRLTGRYEGRRRFYLGRDLLAWLARDQREEVTA